MKVKVTAESPIDLGGIFSGNQWRLLQVSLGVGVGIIIGSKLVDRHGKFVSNPLFWTVTVVAILCLLLSDLYFKKRSKIFDRFQCEVTVDEKGISQRSPLTNSFLSWEMIQDVLENEDCVEVSFTTNISIKLQRLEISNGDYDEFVKELIRLFEQFKKRSENVA